MPTPSSRIALREQLAVIRTIVDNHDVNAANAGYEGEQGFAFQIGDAESRSTGARNHVMDILRYITAQDAVANLWDTVSIDNPRAFAARAFGLRAIRLVARNSQALENSGGFNIRNLNYTDLSSVLASSAVRMRLQGSICTFQYKVDPTPQNAFAFTWALMIDGQVTSRGTQQPLQKFIAAMLKPMQLPDSLTQSSELNEKYRILADTVPNEKKWYFYLSNQNTTKNYLMFKQHRGTDSCMAKDYGFYTDLAPDQNPMDCYDNSPDWNLMFWSEQSPDEIRAMLDVCEANMDGADQIYKYPFMTRCMTLPVNKVIHGKEHLESAGYKFVFGKIYGHDRVVNFFYNEENPFLTHKTNISGGLIPVQYSRKQDREHLRMLPYFDQANVARLITDEDGNEFWQATHRDHYASKSLVDIADRTSNPLVAKCLYQEGIAKYIRAYSPSQDTWVELSTTHPQATITMLGLEYRYDPRHYCNMTLEDGNVVSVPRNWTTEYNGQRYLLRDMSLINGEYRPNELLERDSRYTNHPDFGWMLTRQAELANTALAEMRSND